MKEAKRFGSIGRVTVQITKDVVKFIELINADVGGTFTQTFIQEPLP